MRSAPDADRVLLVVAVVLMLGGVVLLLADLASGGVTIPLMTVGIALVGIAGVDSRRRRGRSPRGI